MPFLKLHIDEPETEPPAPLPFKSDAADQSWRQAQRADRPEEERMDSITQVEQALSAMQHKLDELEEQVDEYFEPIPMSRWMPDEDDDGPWAA